MKNYLDLYSVPVNFTYHKYYRYPSICGGIFSLIIEVLLLAYLIFLLYDISQREFPEIATHTKYNAFPEQISIKSIPSLGEKQNEISSSKHHKETYWSISLGIKKGNDLVKWETTNLEFKVYQKSIDVNGKLSSNEINIEYCTGFGDGFLEQNVFDNMNLKTTKCINSDYNLTGIYGFANSSWLEIELIQTGNIDNNNDDKYQAEFYYQSRNLDLTQYTNDIIVSTLEEMFWDVMPNNIKVSYLKVSLDKVLTNDYYLPRFIVRKYKERYIFTTKSWSDQIKKVSNNNNSNENNKLLILRIIPDIISTTTERMFDDILTQLAMIGGLAGVVFPICFLFVFGIRNFRMSESTMNECYNIIDPQLQDNNHDTIQCFDTFIINHYKKLLSLYKSQNISNNNNKEQTQIKQKERTIGETYNTNNGLSFQTKKEIINKYLNENELEDNEGIDVSMFNPSERFFTLKRIENLYGISEHQRRVISINDDLTNMFNKQNADPIKYVCYKFIYESTIYKSQPKFTFNIYEMFGYFCFKLCCCKRKKKVFNLQTTNENKINKHQNNNNNQTSLSQTKLSNTNITQKHILNKQSNEESNINNKKQNEVSSLEQKYAVYYGANKKLGVDFDIINILKTIEGFDYFIKIYFEKHQRNLFYLAGKPLIQETDDIDEDEENNDIICMYKNLLKMIEKASGELKSYQVRLMKLMGRSDNDIKMLENVIKGKRINDNVYGDFIGGLNQNSERCSVNNNNDDVLQNDSMDLLKNSNQQKENNKEMVRDNISE